MFKLQRIGKDERLLCDIRWIAPSNNSLGDFPWLFGFRVPDNYDYRTNLQLKGDNYNLPDWFTKTHGFLMNAAKAGKVQSLSANIFHNKRHGQYRVDATVNFVGQKDFELKKAYGAFPESIAVEVIMILLEHINNGMVEIE